MTDNPYVFGWMADRDGCGYYRVELPCRAWINAGGRGSYSPDLHPAVRDEADIIIGQRVVGDEPSFAWREFCRVGEKYCVFELDDDLFNIDPSNVAYGCFTPELLANLRRNIECAHAVTVSTPQLADRLSHLNDNIHVVPNCVPRALTERLRPINEHLTLGWAGGISHVRDWDDAAPQVARFMKRNPDVHFHSVGGAFQSMLAFPNDRLRTTRWIDGVDKYYEALDFDFAVIPLRPNLFNQSKSYIKALEFGALGIPVVASAMAPYENYVNHGDTGYLVRRDHEWSLYLRELANNPETREIMGQNAHFHALNHTVEGNLDKWTKVWGVV